MSGGLNRLLVVAVVTSVALVVPTAALACNDGVSAVNVYKECLPSGGGGKSRPAKHSSRPNTGQGSGQVSTPVVSHKTAKVLKHAGRSDRRTLAHLVGTVRGNELQPSRTRSETAPSMVSSAFDLGSGPTALLIVLAGTAVLLLGGSGLRLWQHRRP